MKLFALILFILMYVLMITLPKHRPFYALGVGAVFLVSGVLPFGRLLSTINWNVLMMISGTMIIVYYFIRSLMPNLLADILLEKSGNVMWVTIYMSLFAGLISAFIDNVATVLMVAPVGLAVCKKLGINPVSMISRFESDTSTPGSPSTSMPASHAPTGTIHWSIVKSAARTANASRNTMMPTVRKTAFRVLRSGDRFFICCQSCHVCCC